ncbi:hypothetical protein GT043_41400, partial [Streptomyces sp. SID2131]|nr:hypothetical protein [Streptomyces sp. SID2131]
MTEPDSTFDTTAELLGRITEHLGNRLGEVHPYGNRRAGGRLPGALPPEVRPPSPDTGPPGPRTPGARTPSSVTGLP